MSNFRRIINGIADLIMAHTRIIMPVVLVVCVIITVVIAINARDRAGAEKAEIPQAEYVPEENELPDMLTIPELPLDIDKYPEVNALIEEYHKALTDGDSVLASQLRSDLEELEMIRIEEMGKYIESYETVGVYTKDGLTENSYVAFITSRAKFYDIETYMPGFAIFYIMPDDEGKLTMRQSKLEENIYEYIRVVSLQDNVIDLNNKINVEYNDMLAADRELEEFIAFLSAKIKENVGVVLAQTIQPDITSDQIRSEMDTDDDNDNENQQAITSTMLARATDVVNIRSSDSETADRLDRAIVGQEFTVLEQKGNGWSRIKYGNRDAYIKSEFLEIISEIGGSADSQVSAGKVKVINSSVRVRSTASTSGDILGTVQLGERFDYIEEVSGWMKIKYNNQIGYIRNDFVEKE